MTNKTFQHLNPIWRNKADFIIRAQILPLESSLKPSDWEQLWSRKVSAYTFELCCIPFFIYGYALGDIVEVDQTFVIQNLYKPSGHRTYRIWFDEVVEERMRISIVSELIDQQFVIEYYSEKLVGVNVDSKIEEDITLKFLSNFSNKGLLVFEKGN